MNYKIEYSVLKEILLKYYSSSNSIKSITSGRMKPNSDIRFEIYQKYNIPFEIWDNIKNHLTKKEIIKRKRKGKENE